jgi:uncharacterized Zn finger protein (UPF0148 family)
MHCDTCGAPLECFEGEDYCPDCVRYATEELAAEAAAEAALLRRAEAEWAAAGEGPDDGEPPF